MFFYFTYLFSRAVIALSCFRCTCTLIFRLFLKVMRLFEAFSGYFRGR